MSTATAATSDGPLLATDAVTVTSSPALTGLPIVEPSTDRSLARATVDVSAFVLFAEIASVDALPTLIVLLSTAPEATDGLTRRFTVNELEAPDAIDVAVQVTGVPAVQPAEVWKVVPAGTGTDTTTLAASAGPLFAAETVNASVAPAETEAGAEDADTDRSLDRVTLAVRVAVSPVALASVESLDRVSAALSVFVPAAVLAGTENETENVWLAPAARSVFVQRTFPEASAQAGSELPVTKVRPAGTVDSM